MEAIAVSGSRQCRRLVLRSLQRKLNQWSSTLSHLHKHKFSQRLCVYFYREMCYFSFLIHAFDSRVPPGPDGEHTALPGH